MLGDSKDTTEVCFYYIGIAFEYGNYDEYMFLTIYDPSTVLVMVLWLKEIDMYGCLQINLHSLLSIVLNVDFVLVFGLTKIGKLSNIGENISGNVVNLYKFTKINKKLQISI